MPLTPKYTWEETPAELTLVVSLPGLHKPSLDVFLTDVYAKVNLPPYLLHVDLYQEVDSVRSAALIDVNVVSFRLVKRETALWGRLMADGDKRSILQRRQQSVEAHRERAIQMHQSKLKKKETDEKVAFDKQWATERAQRSLIEERKAAELQAERDDINAFQDKVEGRRREPKSVTRKGGVTIEEHDDSDTEDQDGPDSDEEDDALPVLRGSKAPEAPPQRDFEPKQIDSESESEDEAPAVKRAPPKAPVLVQVPQRVLPPPRTSGTQSIKVEFTQLETGHLPARENREKEIRQFKRQNNMTTVNADTPDITEREPIFLKDKGDGFYNTGNLNAAINAYTTALEMDGGFIRCLANRAACYLQLGDTAACIADCTKALALQSDQDEEAAAREGGAVPRGRLLLRRGRAHAAAGQLSDALVDYQAAARLDPSNQTLARDIAELSACMRPMDVSSLRQRGDERFKQKDYPGAVEAYSLLLQMRGDGGAAMRKERLAAYANRAACHLCRSDFGLAVDDADRGLALIMGQLELADNNAATTAAREGVGAKAEAAAAGDADDSTPGPSVDVHTFAASLVGDGDGGGPGGQWARGDSSGLRASLARLLARRATALGHLKRYSAAAKDYIAAGALQRDAGNVPLSTQLEADAAIMRELDGQTKHQLVAGS